MFLPKQTFLEVIRRDKDPLTKVQGLLDYWREELRHIRHIRHGRMGGNLGDYYDLHTLRNHIRRLRLLRRTLFINSDVKIRVQKKRLLHLSSKLRKFEYTAGHD